MHPGLQASIDRAVAAIGAIDAERRALLDELASFVSSARRRAEGAQLTFICTHNSRRSQMGQLWAAAAAAHFGVDGVFTHSGGTEVTAFHPNAVAAMRRAGFVLDASDGENPHYSVSYSAEAPAIDCFSKVYDDPRNPSRGFAAIMTCSEADEACPVVLGAALRVPLRYEDPKSADGSADEAAVYDERSMQIATEMLYLFSEVH